MSAMAWQPIDPQRHMIYVHVSGDTGQQTYLGEDVGKMRQAGARQLPCLPRTSPVQLLTTAAAAAWQRPHHRLGEACTQCTPPAVLSMPCMLCVPCCRWRSRQGQAAERQRRAQGPERLLSSTQHRRRQAPLRHSSLPEWLMPESRTHTWLQGQPCFCDACPAAISPSLHGCCALCPPGMACNSWLYSSGRMLGANAGH